jgi:hypothetical protein
MSALEIISNPEVEVVFSKYPEKVRSKILSLRKLIIEAVQEMEGVSTLEETLKWGEPSYLTKHGSTLRMDWKPKFPGQYAMYFKCTSKLVETFKRVFDNKFEFQGNRAIVFQMEEEIPEEELKSCIRATLAYHKVKHLPNLGMTDKRD